MSKDYKITQSLTSHFVYSMITPKGILARVAQPDGQTKLQVISIQDSLGGSTADLVRDWKAEAKKDWAEAGHRRWTIVKEQLVSSNLIAAILGTCLCSMAPSCWVGTCRGSNRAPIDSGKLIGKHEIFVSSGWNNNII